MQKTHFFCSFWVFFRKVVIWEENLCNKKWSQIIVKFFFPDSGSGFLSGLYIFRIFWLLWIPRTYEPFWWKNFKNPIIGSFNKGLTPVCNGFQAILAILTSIRFQYLHKFYVCFSGVPNHRLWQILGNCGTQISLFMGMWLDLLAFFTHARSVLLLSLFGVHRIWSGTHYGQRKWSP